MEDLTKQIEILRNTMREHAVNLHEGRAQLEKVEKDYEQAKSTLGALLFAKQQMEKEAQKESTD